MRGFTLVEIAVVILVFGIIVAMAAPSVTGLIRSSRLTGASNTLVADMRYARSLASSQHAQYEIDLSPGSYKLDQSSPRTTVLTRTMPSGVAFTGTDTVTFFSWGLTTAKTINVTGNGNTMTLQVLSSGNITHD
jgi:type IV fimbrial biogenesis protein FimT